jgi:hypothetical protein
MPNIYSANNSNDSLVLNPQEKVLSPIQLEKGVYLQPTKVLPLSIDFNPPVLNQNERAELLDVCPDIFDTTPLLFQDSAGGDMFLLYPDPKPQKPKITDQEHYYFQHYPAHGSISAYEGVGFLSNPKT